MNLRFRTSLLAAAVLLMAQASHAATPVDDGNGPADQWRIPENNLSVRGNAVTASIIQVINSWAQAVDSQNPQEVADLFAPDGKLGLYYTNTATTPWSQAPTGYSPSSQPMGGTPGAGCTAMGQSAIANYVRGTGLAGKFNWPDLTQSRTMLLDTLVRLGSERSVTAQSHSYVVQGAWTGGRSNLQMFATYRLVPGSGWKISELRLLYATAQPALPCQN